MASCIGKGATTGGIGNGLPGQSGSSGIKKNGTGQIDVRIRPRGQGESDPSNKKSKDKIVSSHPKL